MTALPEQRRVLLPGLTIPVDDYAALVAALPGQTVVLDTLATPVTAPTGELRASLELPEAPYELVGHSIGALSALEWAALHADEVSRVVLLDPSDPWGAPVPGIFGGLIGRILVALVGLVARSRQAALALGRWGRRSVLGGYGVTTDPLSPGRVDDLFGSRAALVVVATQVVGVPARVSRVRRLLARVPELPPVVVIASREGEPTDLAASDALAARLGAPLVMTAGGHLFPMTHPGPTAAAMKRFPAVGRPEDTRTAG